MGSFIELLEMSLISVLTIPVNLFFWLVVYLVYVQYKRIYSMEVSALGEARSPLTAMVRNSVFIGLAGGLVGTVIIMTLGITIDTKDFTFIFPLAIALMLINIRYICFSYAGGILALSSLIFGFPKINVSSILAIISILHLVEAILIWFDGSRDAIPILVKHKKDEVVGGFFIQRFWPIPFAILMIANGPLAGGREINLPDWWPIFKGNLDIDNLSLQISAVVAALGYGDMALTSTPKVKAFKSSKRLFVYSLVLLILSIVSTDLLFFKFIAALFATIGHEFLVLIGQREEQRGMPLFDQPASGVRILDIKEDSVGAKMMLQQGDVILSINNKKVHNRGDIQLILSTFPTYIWIDVEDVVGNKRTIEFQDYRTGINNLGVVLVTKDTDVLFNFNNSISIIKNVLHKISESYLKYRENKKLKL